MRKIHFLRSFFVFSMLLHVLVWLLFCFGFILHRDSQLNVYSRNVYFLGNNSSFLNDTKALVVQGVKWGRYRRVIKKTQSSEIDNFELGVILNVEPSGSGLARPDLTSGVGIWSRVHGWMVFKNKVKVDV